MLFKHTFSRAVFLMSILVASHSMVGMKEEPVYFDQQSIHFDFSHDNNTSSNDNNEALEFGNLNDKFDSVLFEESVSRLPLEIDRYIRRSLDPAERKRNSKVIALVGPTGSGKSIAARAIAWKMKREYFFVSALDLLGSILHKGAENIRALFKEFLRFKKLPVLILDEVNFLGDDYIKGNSDAKFTISQLWSKLDLLESIDDFVLIVTGNEFKNLPPQMQNRIEMRIYELVYLLFTKERLLNEIAKYPGYSPASDCTEAFIEEFAQRVSPYSTRNINAMIEYAVELAWDRNSKLITAKDLNDACQRAHYNRQTFCDYTPHLVPEERRHQEQRELAYSSLAMQILMHRASQAQSQYHHQQTYNQSTSHHKETVEQSQNHHNASQALSRAQHRESMNQSQNHHENTQHQGRTHHIESQSQSEMHHMETQLLSLRGELLAQSLAAAQSRTQAKAQDNQMYMTAASSIPILGAAILALTDDNEDINAREMRAHERRIQTITAEAIEQHRQMQVQIESEKQQRLQAAVQRRLEVQQNQQEVPEVQVRPQLRAALEQQPAEPMQQNNPQQAENHPAPQHAAPHPIQQEPQQVVQQNNQQQTPPQQEQPRPQTNPTRTQQQRPQQTDSSCIIF